MFYTHFTSNLVGTLFLKVIFNANPAPMIPDSDLNVLLFWWRVTKDLQPFHPWGWLLCLFDDSQFMLLLSVEKLIVPAVYPKIFQPPQSMIYPEK